MACVWNAEAYYSPTPVEDAEADCTQIATVLAIKWELLDLFPSFSLLKFWQLDQTDEHKNDRHIGWLILGYQSLPSTPINASCFAC